MHEMGLIQPSGTPGAYHLLPLAQRSLDKLTRAVEFFMDGIGGQKIQMPTLIPLSLWVKTGNLKY
jgi:prolyl-tRNA synthetase